jgi:hypothetical protein
MTEKLPKCSNLRHTVNTRAVSNCVGSGSDYAVGLICGDEGQLIFSITFLI